MAYFQSINKFLERIKSHILLYSPEIAEGKLANEDGRQRWVLPFIFISMKENYKRLKFPMSSAFSKTYFLKAFYKIQLSLPQTLCPTQAWICVCDVLGAVFEENLLCDCRLSSCFTLCVARSTFHPKSPCHKSQWFQSWGYFSYFKYKCKHSSFNLLEMLWGLMWDRGGQCLYKKNTNWEF